MEAPDRVIKSSNSRLWLDGCLWGNGCRLPCLFANRPPLTLEGTETISKDDPGMVCVTHIP
jgi:hypothetical protein